MQVALGPLYYALKFQGDSPTFRCILGPLKVTADFPPKWRLFAGNSKVRSSSALGDIKGGTLVAIFSAISRPNELKFEILALLGGLYYALKDELATSI